MISLAQGIALGKRPRYATPCKGKSKHNWLCFNTFALAGRLAALPFYPGRRFACRWAMNFCPFRGVFYTPSYLHELTPDAIGHIHPRMLVAVAHHAPLRLPHLLDKGKQTVALRTSKYLLPTQTVDSNDHYSRWLLLAIPAIHGEQEKQRKEQQQRNQFLLHILRSFRLQKYRVDVSNT